MFSTAHATRTPATPHVATAEKASSEHAAAAAPTRRVRALPKVADSYTGPYPTPRPTRSSCKLERRINALLPDVLNSAQRALTERTGTSMDVHEVPIAFTTRRGLRETLRNQEGCGTVLAFILSWVMPITYAPGLGRVLVVAPTAATYSDDTLKFQLARAVSEGAVGQKHRNFYDHVARRLISMRQRSHDIYACKAWAHALGESVGRHVAPKGRHGPFWQRFAMLMLWPFAPTTVGPRRLARRFVPILETMAKHGAAPLVDRMFRFPALCSTLYGEPGRRPLVVDHTPDYQRGQFRDDVAYLSPYNPQSGAIAYSVES